MKAPGWIASGRYSNIFNLNLSMVNYQYAAQTNIGGRRENQDSHGHAITQHGLVVTVCDGMGGTAGGKLASETAVRAILHEMEHTDVADPVQALTGAIRRANAEIFAKSRQHNELYGMGTTATAMVLSTDKAVIAHVGDSRVYHLRAGEVVWRTFDHSKVFELVRRGVLTEEQARLSQDSNVILRALGISPDVEVDIRDNEPFLKGDLFMLCTDGVCGAVPEPELIGLLKTGKTVEQQAKAVIERINGLGFEQGGGHDNLTAALIEVKQDSTLSVPIDMKTRYLLYGLAVALLLALAGLGWSFSANESLKDKNENLAQVVTRQETKIAQLRDSLRKARPIRNQSVKPIQPLPNDNTDQLPDGIDGDAIDPKRTRPTEPVIPGENKPKPGLPLNNDTTKASRKTNRS